MRLNKTKNECCGCGACAAACPFHAITMKADDEGFLYPVIDDKLCTDCGLCSRVCSFCDDYARAEGQSFSQYYALTHKSSDVRKTSRSGGAFFALATAVLDQGGTVYGVAFDETFAVKHIRVDSVEALGLLQGSKYVQSDKGDSFACVKSDLEQGRAVLFSGTGCEVSGLISYLKATRTDMSRLYTCDVVCHGVPSPLIWQENLARMQKKLGGKADKVSFRDKRFGWGAHIESYQRGKRILFSNEYTTLFCRDISLRPSCADCRFCNYERSGDLTIADFWGSEKIELPMERAHGISLLMVHTDKARELVRAAEMDVCTFEVQKEQTVQPNLVRPTVIPPERSEFWDSYKKLGYKRTVKKYYPLVDRAKLTYNKFLRRDKKW